MQTRWDKKDPTWREMQTQWDKNHYPLADGRLLKLMNSNGSWKARWDGETYTGERFHSSHYRGLHTNIHQYIRRVI